MIDRPIRTSVRTPGRTPDRSRGRTSAALLAGLLASTLWWVVVSPAPAGAAGEIVVTNTAPPTVRGEAVYAKLLRAPPGPWEPAGVTPRSKRP